MKINLTVHWKHVMAAGIFASGDIERFDLWGVRVEFRPDTYQDEWPAVITGADGKRLLSIESKVKPEKNWIEGMPTAFTIPRPLLKRVKKPGKDIEDLAQVSYDLDLGDPGEGEESLGYVVSNVAIRTAWDEVRCSMEATPQKYPNWRGFAPQGPYVVARDVRVSGLQLGDFSAASNLLAGGETLVLFREKVLQKADTNEASRVLIVKNKLNGFFGLIMPSHVEIPTSSDLPLWIGQAAFGEEGEETGFEEQTEGEEAETEP